MIELGQFLGIQLMLVNYMLSEIKNIHMMLNHIITMVCIIRTSEIQEKLSN